MDPSELYDTDFVAWTEQQAVALRGAAGLSNRLDLPHLAEEIESLGRRDVREVERLIRQILLHMLQIVSDPASDAGPHWRLEVAAFQADAAAAFSPSMAQKIELDRLWQHTLRSFMAEFAAGRRATPLACPLTLDDLVDRDFTVGSAVARVATALDTPPAVAGGSAA